MGRLEGTKAARNQKTASVWKSARMTGFGGAIGPGPGAAGATSTSAATRSGWRRASWMAEVEPAE
jgi:hypothetical protein